MFVNKPVFWEYRTFGKDGFWNGEVTKDAPSEVKEALDDFLEEEKEMKRQGIRT